jgi:hypothetical protein
MHYIKGIATPSKGQHATSGNSFGDFLMTIETETMKSTSKKTSISMSSHSARLLERNRFLPDRSARINQVISRYHALISAEAEAVSDLVGNSFLSFVVGEWLDMYPLAMGLPQIVQHVYEERKLDNLAVPSDDEIEALTKRLSELNVTQETALVEIIEGTLA